MATAFVSFDEVKAAVPIEAVAIWLGIDKGLTRTANQLKGDCPFCKSRDSFKITFRAEKFPTGAFNCFSCPAGGDQLELLSQHRGNPKRHSEGLKAAAHELRQHFCGNSNSTQSTVRKNRADTSPQPQARKSGFDAVAYAKTLDPAHAALEPLGVSQETLRLFAAGYSASGINRGRLALPVQDRNGEVVCYLGRSLKGESPLLTFPNGVNPAEFIFNGHTVREGELYLVREPLQVLQAVENGVDNVVCFLTPITPQQLEMLAALCDERKCETVELF